MPTNIDYSNIHMASHESAEFSSIPVILGDTPPIVVQRAKAGVSMPAYTVVGRDADNDGVLVPATAAIPPIGILCVAVDTTVPGAEGWVPYWAAGTFNYAALVFSADFATEQQKKDAFVDTGVQIFLDKPRYDQLA